MRPLDETGPVAEFGLRSAGITRTRSHGHTPRSEFGEEVPADKAAGPGDQYLSRPKPRSRINHDCISGGTQMTNRDSAT